MFTITACGSHADKAMVAVNADLFLCARAALERLFLTGRAVVLKDADPQGKSSTCAVANVWHDREWLLSIDVLYAQPILHPDEAARARCKRHQAQQVGGGAHGLQQSSHDIFRPSELQHSSLANANVADPWSNPSRSWTVGGIDVQLSCVAVLQRESSSSLLTPPSLLALFPLCAPCFPVSQAVR